MDNVMDNLAKCIDILFRRVSPTDVLERYFNIERLPLSEDIDKDMFSSLALSHWSSRYTDDEIDLVFKKLKEDGVKREGAGSNKDQPSVFNLLLKFGQETLTEKDSEPLCQYQHLLEWNELSRNLGEDLFTTSFLAYKDFKALRERHFFSWPPIISTDNTRIKQLLAKGLAENHFHLKGSAPHFSISWICLMNQFKNRQKAFKEIEKQTRLEPEIVSRFSRQIPNLYSLVKRAAYIRAFLFCLLKNCPRKDTLFDEKKLKLLLKPGKEDEFNIDEFDIHTHKIQHEVELLKYTFGKSFGDAIPDYAIPKSLAKINFNGNTLLTGERYFLYTVFKEIFKQNPDLLKYRELFYAYLVIKEKLRQEFIQVNQRIGFRNFQKYQDRKEHFITRKSIYEKALYYLSVNSSMKNQKLLSFETRITPPDTRDKLERYIKKIDNYLETDIFDTVDYDSLDRFLHSSQKKKKDNKNENIQFYTLHFIKFKDSDIKKQRDERLFTIPRDNRERKWVKRQAFAIMELRQSLNPTASRIRGIDAASSEIGCRPEVFAQAFRFLKEHCPAGKYELFKGDIETEIKKMGATFHVGEDFLDIVDGLRAIDEAVKFLYLTQGDRIGHALALGIDASDYYELKQHKVILPKQDFLDNIAWMLARIRRYGTADFPQLVYWLEKQYNRLFSEIYLNHQYSIDKLYPPTIYYDAWRLRGDNPMLYLNSKYDKNSIPLTYWQRCAENRTYPKERDTRENETVTSLYHHYHFNPGVKRKGIKIEEFQVEKSYIQAVSVIQEEIQKEIRDRGIGIETNPSSNFLIGCFRNYCKHPLINFYNLGLTTDSEKISNCPQLFVSINTDDQGVFNTYLEKEYALMALALEKEEDPGGKKIYNASMIYDWLDRIRQMGLEQSFR